MRSRRLSKGWRTGLTVLIVTNAAAALYYQAMILSDLKETSALFIGVPVVLALLTIHLTRTGTTYGAVIRANLVFLLVVAPLLGEGSICLLMAAPLFLGVSLAVTLALEKRRGHNAALLAILAPALFGMAETGANLMPEIEEVYTTSTVRGDVQDWKERIHRGFPPAESRSTLLGLGFPVPREYTVEQDIAIIQFTPAEGVAGYWQAHLSNTVDGVHYRILEDTTKLSHWMTVLDSQVSIVEAGEDTLILTQTTRFRPKLRPLWYFVPVQKLALSKAHEIALRTWNMEN